MDTNNRSPGSPPNPPENLLELLAYRRQLFPSSAVAPSHDLMIPASGRATAVANHRGLVSSSTEQRPKHVEGTQGRSRLAQQQQKQRKHQMPNRRVSNANASKKNFDRKSSFPLNLYIALHEVSFPNALRWSDDGKGFFVNERHPTMVRALEKYFKSECNSNRCHIYS